MTIAAPGYDPPTVEERLARAEAELRLYRAALAASEAIRHQLIATLVTLRTGPAASPKSPAGE